MITRAHTHTVQTEDRERKNKWWHVITWITAQQQQQNVCKVRINIMCIPCHISIKFCMLVSSSVLEMGFNFISFGSKYYILFAACSLNHFSVGKFIRLDFRATYVIISNNKLVTNNNLSIRYYVKRKCCAKTGGLHCTKQHLIYICIHTHIFMCSMCEEF